MKLKAIALSLACSMQLISTNSIADVTRLQVNSTTYWVTEVSGSYLQLQDRLQNTDWYKVADSAASETLQFNLLREYRDVNVYGLFNSAFDFDGEDAIMRVFADPLSLPDIVIDSYGLSRSSVNPNTILSWLVSVPFDADTLSSLRPNAFALRNAFNIQSAKTAQGLIYDCTVFDANNICVSFAGTRSNGDNGFNATSGALIIAHRPTANIRFGAYVDQSMGNSDSNGLKVKRGSPSYGVFGVWSQRADDLGTQVRVAANSGKVDIETTRLAIETAEAGFGQSNIKSNGVQLEASQGYALNNQWTTRPYVGYRQMTNKRAAYTESSTVDFPLAYAGLKQTTESILAGIRFVGKLTPQTSLNLSAGVERDVKSTVDNYQASFVDGEAIDPISMTQNIKKTRPTASVGLVHSLDKTQTVGLFVTHRKEALESSSTTSGMLQYSVGF